MKNEIKTVFNRITLCSIFCLTVLCLSGCVNIETNISIDRHGNAVLEEQTLLKQETLQVVNLFENDFSVDNAVNKIKELNDPNITAEKFEQDNHTVIKITKKFYNIQKQDINFNELFMEDCVDTQLGSGRFVDVNKNFFTTNYNFNFNINMQEDIEYVHPKLTLSIPVKAKKHNATSVDSQKHIYTWEINKPEQNVFLSYTILNIGNVLLCTFLVLLILLGSILIISLKSKQ